MGSISPLLIVSTGGTAAGLIVADPPLKILVWEAGLHTEDSHVCGHTQPALYFSHLAPTSKTDIQCWKSSQRDQRSSVDRFVWACVGYGFRV